MLDVMKVGAVAGLLFASASGCGGGSASAFVGSCNNASQGVCNEFTGSSYTATQVQKTCVALGAVAAFLPDRCPTASRVGTCLVYKGQATESYYRYYATFPGTAGATAQTAGTAAEKQCGASLKGEWTPN